ncbi:MAG: nitrous oxide reductase family maturation protein NosD [Gammaproteobacteria bacterium]|nr:nitrous oxide reductase family maturation protein NosD [Gammaproteobacteria bacterium]
MLKYLAVYLLCMNISLVANAGELPSFQDLVDAAEPNSTLVPPPGVYAGPVVLDYPLTIDGKSKVTIDGGGEGSVIYIDTDGAVLKNLHLTGSGNSHNDIDAGVQVRGNFNVIKDNRIDDCLFGVDLQQSNNNIVRRNRISSKDVELGVRGDSVRLWYSFNNKITDNTIRDSRDMVVWYSADNTISGNDSRYGRYSLHFMYSRFNHVESNHYENNSVGIFLMYSDSVVIRNNYIAYANGPTGMGVGFKETSDIDISGNQILYCATGLYIDVSPYDPESTNRIRDNVIAFTSVAINFLNDWTGNIFESNTFRSNQIQISVAGGKTANRNIWKGNYWDDYEGFDLDHDGVGDSAYELYGYADRIWMDVPAARFLQGTPVMAVLDFLERLAPFSTPDLLVRDKHPAMSAHKPVVLSES